MIIPDSFDIDSEFYQKWIKKNDDNVITDLDGNSNNPMNEFLLLGRVNTIHELYQCHKLYQHHELYLRGISQSKSFYNHHFPKIPYRHSFDLPYDLKKQYQKIRRKMAIPMAMGKLKHQISKDINVLNNTSGKTNWQADYYDIVIRNSQTFKAYKKYIQGNPKKWKSDNFLNNFTP